jgi:hypothetical protein
VWFGGLWGQEDAEQAALSISIIITEQLGGGQSGVRRRLKTQKWQRNARHFGEHTYRLLLSSFLVPRLFVHWIHVRGGQGASSSTAISRALAVLPLSALLRLTAYAFLHVSLFTINITCV